jgi:hypothetical protein
MEAFENFVSIALTSEGYVVGGPYKFPLTLKTAKATYDEFQTHGYEVDLVGASSDRLILATVKSFFGSTGVKANEVMGKSGNIKGYKLLNNPEVRDGVLKAACERYGYKPDQVEFRLYGGRFQSDANEAVIREWAAGQKVGSGPIRVFNAEEVVGLVQEMAKHKTYSDNPSLVAVKVLNFVNEKLEKAATKQAKTSAPKSRKKYVPGPTFPIAIGALVRSVDDGFEGFVLGYSTQNSSVPYVKVYNEDSGVTKIRSVKKVTILS